MIKKKIFNNGVEIPMLGLGVYQTKDGAETVNAVKWALEAGYRHIDTAAVYGNENSVGLGIKESGIPREEIFLTTKLWNEDIRKGRELEAFEESLKRLQTDYVDLYLIHWPVENREKSWKVLEEIYASGRAKAIGVSNFQQHHLEKLLAVAKVIPAINQVEAHPYLNNNELADYCRSKGIAMQAYSPLGGTGGNLLENEVLNKLAEKYNRTPAQIVICWDIQRDFVVIPKSVHKDRIISNLEVDFELLPEDMEVINSLNCGKRFGPDPDHFDF
ncbi:MAG: aldo/keto reductase [Herbinix sp.]|jgi:diketogulonate reductase-like aldo/keto reductase|nr:aldo/keto reductase [Herbinix sp.]